MQSNFLYLTWDTKSKHCSNKNLQFHNDTQSSVSVVTSVGPYKNNYATIILQKNHIYYWEIKIIRGTYFKIGVMKHSTLVQGFKGNAFSDHIDGFSYYSAGKLRNGSNSTGTEFGKGYGPGDIVKISFNTKQGKLCFGKNDEELKLGFEDNNFKKGGYVPAVASLIEGSKYSLTIPDLQD